MEYQVTARKWRPQAFKEIIGQSHLIRALQNALSSGKVPHAYLFSGPRGVGKTTTARILAKSLNCPHASDAEPCNECATCQQITNGYSMDVIEIDGASNRGIDSIREIRNTVTYLPISAKYKIYIIDEVHMLTKEASNALLKTLEEPPEHVIFILATTEPHNVIATIRSRCQHYIFKKIPVKTIISQLATIAAADGIKCSEEGLFLIANAADGSMRDSESIFDQVVLYSGGDISEKTVADVIGIPEQSYFSDLLKAAAAGDIVSVLRVAHKYIENVGDIKLFVKGLVGYLRLGMLAKKLESNDELLDITEAKYDEIRGLFGPFTFDDTGRIINLFVDLYKDLRGDANERFLLEMALFKLVDYKNLVTLGELRGEILALGGRDAPQDTQAGGRTGAGAGAKQNAGAPIQYQKIQSNARRGQGDDGPGDEGYPFPPDDEGVKGALKKTLTGHIIMKTMIQQIKSVQVNKGAIKVDMATAHSCEFFTENKREIVESIRKLTGVDCVISFLYRNTECAADVDMAAGAKGLLKTINPLETGKHNVESGGKAKDKQEDRSDAASTIADLFDGKIEP